MDKHLDSLSLFHARAYTPAISLGREDAPATSPLYRLLHPPGALPLENGRFVEEKKQWTPAQKSLAYIDKMLFGRHFKNNCGTSYRKDFTFRHDLVPPDALYRSKNNRNGYLYQKENHEPGKRSIKNR